MVTVKDSLAARQIALFHKLFDTMVVVNNYMPNMEVEIVRYQQHGWWYYTRGTRDVRIAVYSTGEFVVTVNNSEDHSYDELFFDPDQLMKAFEATIEYLLPGAVASVPK